MSLEKRVEALEAEAGSLLSTAIPHRCGIATGIAWGKSTRVSFAPARPQPEQCLIDESLRNGSTWTVCYPGWSLSKLSSMTVCYPPTAIRHR